jgi:hypothetical protein
MVTVQGEAEKCRAVLGRALTFVAPLRDVGQSAKTPRVSWMKNEWSWPLFGSFRL